MTDPTEVIARAMAMTCNDSEIGWEHYTLDAEEVVTALAEKGYVIVPSEPTEGMRAAADGELDCAGANDLVEVELRDALGVAVYRAMLAARGE